MKFIRMKVKKLNIEDDRTLQELVNKKFNLSIALPLPDVYNKTVTDQELRLSNYTTVDLNKFDFSSLTLYNFKVSNETFNTLAQSDLRVTIEGHDIAGKICMNKLLLAEGYKMHAKIPLVKTISLNKKKKRGPKTVIKGGKKLNGKPQDSDEKSQFMEVAAGNLEVELNLQAGDTEEELEKNYQ
jgi:hypothetical protein